MVIIMQMYMPSNSSIDLQVTPQISKAKGSDYLHYKLLLEFLIFYNHT